MRNSVCTMGLLSLSTNMICFLKSDLFILSLNILLACMSVHCMCKSVQCSWGLRKEADALDRSYKELSTAMGVLQTNPGTSGRATQCS